MADDLPRVVIDTNVWISAFINAGGGPAKVLDAFWAHRFVPVVAQELLDEIQTVLNRPRIRRRCRFNDAELALVQSRLRDRAITVVPAGALHICRDPRDDFLIETAILGSAHFVVTRDDDLKRDLDLMTHLRRQGIEVLSVTQFLDALTSWPTT